MLGVLVILKSGAVPSISSIHFTFLFSLHSAVAASTSYAAVDRFLRHADAEAYSERAVPTHSLQQTAEEDTKHTKGGLDLLT